MVEPSNYCFSAHRLRSRFSGSLPNVALRGGGEEEGS